MGAGQGRLAGKTALITGGGSGIGRATAVLFAAEGAAVAVNDIDPLKASDTTHCILAAGGTAVALPGDVSEAGAASGIVEAAVKRFGRLDIVVNNAGIIVAGRVDTTPEEEFDRAMRVNVKAAFLVSKYAVQTMTRSGGGVIVNNASANAIVADYDVPSYCASKGGVGMLTRAMALDYAKKCIRVNAVCYGEIHTPLAEQEARDRGEDWDDFAKLMGTQHPLGRMGEPEEAALAVLFLASDDSSFVTGALLSVDGGFTAY